MSRKPAPACTADVRCYRNDGHTGPHAYADNLTSTYDANDDVRFGGPDCGPDCQRERGHVGDHRAMPEGDEWATLGNIECRCGDVYPTVESFHEHIHLSHPNADHPAPPEGTRLVLMTDGLMNALVDVVGADQMSWGEPDGHGWYTPTITKRLALAKIP